MQRTKPSTFEFELHVCSLLHSGCIITSPSHSDGPGHIAFSLSDHLALLQDLTTAFISQLVDKPPHRRHSIPPRLKAKVAQLLRREGASNFRRAEGFGRMPGGEEALEMAVHGRSSSI